MKITPDQIEQLGQLANRADNLIAALWLDLPHQTHFKMVESSLETLSQELKKVVQEIRRKEPWAHQAEN